MRVKQSLTGLFIGCGIALFSTVSRADSTVSFNLSGEYSDSTTFSGSLTYDQTTQAFTAGTIVDNSALEAFTIDFGPEIYTGSGAYTIAPPSGCISGCDQFGAEFYTAANTDSLPYLDLYFSGDPSTFSGGAIESAEVYVGIFGMSSSTSQEVIGEGLTRQVISGELAPISATPEPASALLLLPGSALVAMAVRRKLKHA